MNILAQLVNENGGVTAAGTWLVIAIVVLGVLAVIVRNVIGSMADGKKLWGRKPSISEDLEKLKEELKLTAPAEIVDPIVERLGTFVTWDQLTAMKFVDQAQMDRRITEVKEQISRTERDLSQQIKELRAYLHDDVHKFREYAQSVWSNAELQREGLHSRINVMAEALSEIRGWMRAKFKTEAPLQ